MDRIVRLDARQEAELQRVANNFVAYHKGDVMKALKEMIVLNGEMQQRLEALGDRTISRCENHIYQ
ncbi:MAG TPA: hypothetical protein VGV39_04510 [Mesorhizobium sp.]|jgi:hypothetical protein|uniref:hypothetical protein n=1 Tax=Mesorhizobium sp. TaxID=1871066 RepID=UPI002DDD4E3C|nr:hypothetical protein [Mesorhizobium sp.]HEV2502310.1 hypothetical protein [Mesorhizobium sp.]